jgi:amino acid transporter
MRIKQTAKKKIYKKFPLLLLSRSNEERKILKKKIERNVFFSLSSFRSSLANRNFSFFFFYIFLFLLLFVIVKKNTNQKKKKKKKKVISINHYISIIIIAIIMYIYICSLFSLLLLQRVKSIDQSINQSTLELIL